MTNIIGADQRLSEKRGVKALVVGPTGVGKTSLLRTLDPAHTLFVDIEAGDRKNTMRRSAAS
jgi:predicted GTPase